MVVAQELELEQAQVQPLNKVYTSIKLVYDTTQALPRQQRVNQRCVMPAPTATMSAPCQCARPAPPSGAP